MPRDPSGSYTLPLAPVVTDTPIATTWANPTMDDLAQSMTDSLSRSGKGGMTAVMKLVDTSVGQIPASPALQFNSESNSGIYRAAQFDIRHSLASEDMLRLYQDGIGDRFFQFWDGTAFQDILYSGAPLTTILANDTYLQADNQAGNGTVNIVKVNTSDEIEFGAVASKFTELVSIERTPRQAGGFVGKAFTVFDENSTVAQLGMLSVGSVEVPTVDFGGSISLTAAGTGQTNYPMAQIAGRWEGAGLQGYLQFSTTNNVGTTIEGMRIDSAQDVTIPNGTLTVNGSLSVVGARSSFQAANEAFAIGAKYGAGGDFVYFGADAATSTPAAVISNASGTPLITAAFSGNIAIPNGNLTLPRGQGSGLSFNRAGTAYEAFWQDTSATDNLYIDNVHPQPIHIRVNTFAGATDAIIVGGTADVTIPNGILRVDGTGVVTHSAEIFSATATALFLGTNSGQSQLRVGSAGNTAVFWELGRDNSVTGDFIINNGATEAFRISATNNVTIPAGDLIINVGDAIIPRVLSVTNTNDAEIGCFIRDNGFIYQAKLIANLANAAFELNTPGYVAAGGALDAKIRLRTTGNQAGLISCTNTTTAYGTTSDPRLKSVFREIKPETAYALIEQAHDQQMIGEFDWLDGSGTMWGYNAHKLLDSQDTLGGVEGVGSRTAPVDNDLVMPASVDQSKRVPLLEAALYGALQRLKELENPVVTQ